MFGRLFGKRKTSASADEDVPARPAVTASRSGRDLAVREPTIGLCFNYTSGTAWIDERLVDVGMDVILKTLAASDLRATFFCSAKSCETAGPLLRRIADQGHEVAVLGYADEVATELTQEALAQLVIACRAAFRRIGLQPVGFRSAKSPWDERLTAILAQQGFRYSAEHDHAHQPYWLTEDSRPIARIPIRTDDRGLRRSGATYDEVVSKHLRVLRKTIQRRSFATICFHPWILAEAPERMDHWRDWLSQALGSARVGPLGVVTGIGE